MRTFDELCRDLTAKRRDLGLIEVWAVECMELDETAEVLTGTLYAHYKAWAQSNGSVPMSHRAVSNRLKASGLETRRTGAGRWWIGFRLKGTQTI